MRGSFTFMDKGNRDRKASELKRQGFMVRKHSMRNQLLHPMYVDDWPEKISDEDKGFGNTIYKTHFAALYMVSIQ